MSRKLGVLVTLLAVLCCFTQITLGKKQKSSYDEVQLEEQAKIALAKNYENGAQLTARNYVLRDSNNTRSNLETVSKGGALKTDTDNNEIDENSDNDDGDIDSDTSSTGRRRRRRRGGRRRRRGGRRRRGRRGGRRRRQRG